MPEWIKDLILAIGGGAFASIGILTVFKSLLIKIFETGIESSFEKSLEKYRNKLSRSSKAYDILLEREMRFYERMEPIFAELIPLMHTMKYCMEKSTVSEHLTKCEEFKEGFLKYTDLYDQIRNETLIHQSYLPANVLLSSNMVVKKMYDDLNFWKDSALALFEQKYEDIDDVTIQGVLEDLFKTIAIMEVHIKNRLEELSST